LVIEVVVNSKGQVTIPIKIRKKLKIVEGTTLWVLEKNEGLMLMPKKNFWDMIGAFSDKASVEEMNQLHNKLRHEEENE
jgi:AbrB family looped-hinge helix DNA binding protein